MSVEGDYKFAQAYPTVLLECRTLRHHWNLKGFRVLSSDEMAKVILSADEQAVIRELECSVCQTLRVDLFTRRRPFSGARYFAFQRVRSWYNYPRGYTYKGDGSPPKSDIWVAEQYRRTSL